MSTAGADVEIALAHELAAAGGGLVDAPILGAPPFVRKGEAAILIGGDDLDVRLASPVLEHFGTVRHVGAVGSAARLKLVANSMLADVVLAAAELQVAGEDAGLAPDDVFWVLKRFAPQLASRRRGFVDDSHEPAMFALRDLLKDLDLALTLFEPGEVRTPLTARARQLVASAAGPYGQLDITAVARRYRQPRTIDAATSRTTPVAAIPAS
jgi:3-hydroxyisobutyrate dehydrogenase